MIPAAKLERLLDRFAAIESEMSSGASGPAFVKLSREHAELAPVIETARAYRDTQRQIEDADALIADPSNDSEMRGLAEQERADLRDKLSGLDRELKLQLLPKDAADSSSAVAAKEPPPAWLDRLAPGYRVQQARMAPSSRAFAVATAIFGVGFALTFFATLYGTLGWGAGMLLGLAIRGSWPGVRGEIADDLVQVVHSRTTPP